MDLVDLLVAENFLNEQIVTDLALKCVSNGHYELCLQLLRVGTVELRDLVFRKLFDEKKICGDVFWVKLVAACYTVDVHFETLSYSLINMPPVELNNLLQEVKCAKLAHYVLFVLGSADRRLVYTGLSLLDENIRIEWLRTQFTNVVETDIDLNNYYFPLVGRKSLLSESLLIRGLVGSSDRHVRRGAQFLLKSSTSAKSVVCPLFWEIYDSVDEYSSTVFKSVFAQICKLENLSTVWVLLERIFTHENPVVIKHATRELLSDLDLAVWFVNQFDYVGRLTSWLLWVERGWVACFNLPEISAKISLLITNFLQKNSQNVTRFLTFTLYECKLYFPIAFCYWTGLAAITLAECSCVCSHISLCDKYLDEKLLAFSSLVRPALELLIWKFVSRQCVFESDPVGFARLVGRHGKEAFSFTIENQPLFKKNFTDYMNGVQVVEFSTIQGFVYLGVDGCIDGCVSETRRWMLDVASGCLSPKSTFSLKSVNANRYDLVPLYERLLCLKTFSCEKLESKLWVDLFNDDAVAMTVAMILLSRMNLCCCEASLWERVLKLEIPHIDVEVQILVLPELVDNESFSFIHNRTELRTSFAKHKWILIFRLLERLKHDVTHVHATHLQHDQTHVHPVNDSSECLLENFACISVSDILQYNEVVSICLCRGIILNVDEFLVEYTKIANSLIANRNNVAVGMIEIYSMIQLVMKMNVSQVCPFVYKMLKIGEKSNPIIARCAIALFAQKVALCNTTELSKELIELLVDLVVYKEGLNNLEVEGRETGSSNVDESSCRWITLCAISKIPNIQQPVCKRLVERMVRMQSEITQIAAKTGPFLFSEFHRIQLRIGQALVFLIDQCVDPSKLLSKFFECMQWSHQPDVRDYLEIICIRILHREKELLVEKLLPVLKKWDLPSQAICSFVIIASFFVCTDTSNCGGENCVCASLIPYLTSNASYIRGIAQRALYDKPALIGTDSAAYLLNNKECVAMRRRLKCVYDTFDPFHGDIDTISVNCELVPSRVFLSAIKQAAHECLENAWHYTREDTDVVAEQKIVASTNLVGHGVQRKYIPQKGERAPHTPQIGTVFANPIGNIGVVRQCSDLIVVTSLLDKVTNIAGLCRSAEIFGACTLVVPNLAILRDASFQAMCVTSDQWIKIVEVHPIGLASYIQKLDGYTTVCLEQTSNSVQIDKYKFPTKTCLILGNEKAGVDANYMHLMDTCVEIPQKGIVRSLNVHVSGAIAIWHYNMSQT